MLNTMIRLAVSLIFWPTIFLILLGSIQPLSESAAGGNYNLHYLSPVARRMMTPFRSLNEGTVQARQNQPFAVYDSTEMHTLYVPGAGFLWSDDMRWAQSLPEHLRESHDREGWSVEQSDRVLFQDRFLERYPWIFQASDLSPTSKRRTKNRLIRSGSGAKLFSPTR